MNTLHIAFWNTSLSAPKVGSKYQLVDIVFAYKVILDIFFENKASLVILCEINEGSYKFLENMLSDYGFSSQLLNDSTGKNSEFDLACFFNPSKLEIKESISIINRLGTSKLKTAQRLVIKDIDTNTEIVVFASHWTSKLMGIGEDNRNTASQGLRYKIESFFSEGKKQVICLGDYNDEPYSHSLFKNLKATNDRALVISEPDFWLYNPFWKKLSARLEYYRKNTEHDFGTCYSKAGNRNHWSVFDQMIFAGSFMTEGPWFLDERKTGLVFSDSLLKIIMDRKKLFDHFPIIGTIEFHDEVKNV